MKAPAEPQLMRRILTEVKKHRRFCIVGHVRPDGDCIGSQLALAFALRQAGKEAVCWNEDAVPDKLAFLDPDRLFQRPNPGQEFDCVIATDSASFERLGAAGTSLGPRQILINIDHHRSNTRFGDVNWIADSDSSTGELIFRLLKLARWNITPAIADCLFTAISTDTGSFQYPSTRPATYIIAAELVEKGANLGRICNEVYQSYPLSRVRLLKLLYNRFHLTQHNRVAYFWLKRDDFTRTGATPADSEGLIDHIRAIEPVIVAIMFEEVSPDLARLSFRSKDPRVDVNRIAGQFGGGGHPSAAGARIQGNFLATQRKVLAAVKRELAQARLE